MHCTFLLLPVENTKQISISTYKYTSRKRSEKFVIFKTATDRRSVKKGILKSVIKLSLLTF